MGGLWGVPLTTYQAVARVAAEALAVGQEGEEGEEGQEACRGCPSGCSMPGSKGCSAGRRTPT